MPLKHDDSKKTILLSYGTKTVDKVELYKDPGEIPNWISKLYGYEAIIDDYYDENYQITKYHNVYLHQYKEKGILKEIKKYLYVYQNAKNIDLLYLIHTSPQSYLRACAYRLGGGNGKIYLKMDAEASSTGKLMRWENILPIKILYCLLKPLPDVITIETKKAYFQMSTSCWSDLLGKKLFQMPNGFDDEQLGDAGISRIPVNKKEKILLSVARIGTPQKNTEMLLDILSKVDLKGWKVYIAGPIEENFNSKINMFYTQNPHLKDSVIFTGRISQKEKFDLYNRARLFILTSRHESFGFVLAEAAYMRDYIVSTDVGAIADILDVGNGYNVCSNRVQDFISILNNIFSMSNMELNQLIQNNDLNKLTWKEILKNNVGIQHLISNDESKRKSPCWFLGQLFSPLLIQIIIVVGVLVHIVYARTLAYSLLMGKTQV